MMIFFINFKIFIFAYHFLFFFGGQWADGMYTACGSKLTWAASLLRLSLAALLRSWFHESAQKAKVARSFWPNKSHFFFILKKKKKKKSF